MTVKELIESLQQEDPNAVILKWNGPSSQGEASHVARISRLRIPAKDGTTRSEDGTVSAIMME